MNKAEKELMNKAMEAMMKLGQLKAGQKSASAERLEAMALIVKEIPWADIDSMEINWKTVESSDGAGTGLNVDLMPTLHVEMKEKLP